MTGGGSAAGGGSATGGGSSTGGGGAPVGGGAGNVRIVDLGASITSILALQGNVVTSLSNGSLVLVTPTAVVPVQNVSSLATQLADDGSTAGLVKLVGILQGGGLQLIAFDGALQATVRFPNDGFCNDVQNGPVNYLCEAGDSISSDAGWATANFPGGAPSKLTQLPKDPAWQYLVHVNTPSAGWVGVSNGSHGTVSAPFPATAQVVALSSSTGTTVRHALVTSSTGLLVELDGGFSSFSSSLPDGLFATRVTGAGCTLWSSTAGFLRQFSLGTTPEGLCQLVFATVQVDTVATPPVAATAAMRFDWGGAQGAVFAAGTQLIFVR